MDVIIFCGGRGSRMSDETYDKPKPMINIGDKPILWHIMKMYSNFGFKRFILTLGYKGSVIKEWFDSNLTNESWDIEFVETGIESEKGARLKKVENFIKSKDFHVTYGDGVSDINIKKLVDFHKEHKGIHTMTVVRPPSRFGFVSLDGNVVDEFEEKPQMQSGFINGGFFVIEPKFLEYIEGDEIMFEREPLEKATEEGELMAFEHEGFWQCMDTKRDHQFLEKLWSNDKAPWKK